MKLSWVNTKIEVSSTKRKGRGLFAVDEIKKDEIIIVVGGRIMTEEQIDSMGYRHFAYHCFQVEEDFYICPGDPNEASLDGTFCMNHSCNPSCGVRGQVTFVAMHDISAGEEVTYDYAMTDVDDKKGGAWHPMECLCGSYNCRGVITGDDWKDKELQQKYRGYFSAYVQRMIDNQK